MLIGRSEKGLRVDGAEQMQGYVLALKCFRALGVSASCLLCTSMRSEEKDNSNDVQLNF